MNTRPNEPEGCPSAAADPKAKGPCASRMLALPKCRALGHEDVARGRRGARALPPGRGWATGVRGHDRGRAGFVGWPVSTGVGWWWFCQGISPLAGLFTTGQTAACSGGTVRPRSLGRDDGAVGCTGFSGATSASSLHAGGPDELFEGTEKVIDGVFETLREPQTGVGREVG